MTKLDDAVAAVDDKLTIKMAGPIQLQLLGDPARPAVLSMPVDITDMELISLMVAVAQIGDQLRAKRPASRLILPS